MSFRALIWAVDQDIDPLEKVVLMTLADHHNGKDGMCFPGLPLLVERTGMGLSTVKKKLASLIARGLISRYAWGRTSAYVLAITGIDEKPDPEAPSRHKRRANGPPRSLVEAPAEPTGLSQSLEWALSEPHNQEPNRETNQELNPPRPLSSEIAVRRTATRNKTAQLPLNWNFHEDHVHAAQAACERRCNWLMIDKVKEHQPGFLRDFAGRYVAEQVVVFRRWAQNWRSGPVNWDDEFHEWLRKGFAKMGKNDGPALTHEGRVLTLSEMVSGFYSAKTDAESRELERMDPDYEARTAEAARKAAEQAESERRWSMTDEERQAEHDVEKRRSEAKWWSDRAQGFRKTMEPAKFDDWLKNVPEPARELLPDWCQNLLGKAARARSEAG